MSGAGCRYPAEPCTCGLGEAVLTANGREVARGPLCRRGENRVLHYVFTGGPADAAALCPFPDGACTCPGGEAAANARAAAFPAEALGQLAAAVAEGAQKAGREFARRRDEAVWRAVLGSPTIPPEFDLERRALARELLGFPSWSD